MDNNLNESKLKIFRNRLIVAYIVEELVFYNLFVNGRAFQVGTTF